MADDIFKELEFPEEDTGAPKTEQGLLDWITNQVNNYYGHDPEVRHYSLVRFCPYTSTPPIYAMHIKNFRKRQIDRPLWLYMSA